MGLLRKFVILFTTIVCFLSGSVNAAGPVTHVYLGQKWLAQFAPHYTPEQKQQFLLGTVFPDIRYLGPVKRQQTHFNGMTLQRVMAAGSPFEQGMYFHSFVDEFRDKYVRKKGIMKKIEYTEESKSDLFLKLVEDQIISSKNDFTDFRNHLVIIPQEEKNFGIDEKILNEWHIGLALYFSTQPIYLLSQISFFDTSMFHIEPQLIKQLSEALPKYAQNQFFIDHVQNLLTHFENELENSHRKIKTVGL